MPAHFPWEWAGTPPHRDGRGPGSHHCAALDARVNDDARGQVIRDGSDPPRLVRAQKITRLAAAFGVQPA